METDATRLKTTAAAEKLKLAAEALAPFEAVHRDLLAVWATLETKAQGATAIAGVFLGATISILTRSAPTLSDSEKTLIIVIAGFLAAAVILALLAMLPRALPSATDPEHRFRRVRDLIALEDDAEFLSLLNDFYTNDREQWVGAIAALRNTINLKAKMLYGSQIAIGIAILAAVALVKSMLSV